MKSRSSKGTLCILVRGWTDASSPNALEASPDSTGLPPSFEEFIRDIDGVETVEVVPLDMALFSSAQPEELAESIIRFADQVFDPSQHDRIVFVGYSAGGALLRYALMQAHRDQRTQHHWLNKDVELRAVYLAGILRGWELSTATPAFTRFLSPVLVLISYIYCFLRDRGRPMILSLRRGSPFIVKGRLMQIDLCQLNGRSLPFEQLQFLGRKDEFIAPSDCIELNGDPRQLFVEVPQTNHHQMLDVAADQPIGSDLSKEAQSKREMRGDLLVRAIMEPFEDWQNEDELIVAPDDLNDYFDDLDRPHPLHGPGTKDPVEKAVIILHGIRDNGFWTKRVARMLKTNVTQIRLRAPSPTYGFFSLLDFAWRPRRDAQTRWFMDQYANVRECYPTARISFVGHSNGTYLAHHGMALCEMLKFDRIVFAGSVVRTDVDWAQYNKQVTGGVLNLKGTKDHVVSMLPGAMQKLGLRFLNVGGAGFHGFDKASQDTPPVHNSTLDGGHGAGISEPAWDGIAEFIMDGTHNNLPQAERASFDDWLGRVSHILFLIGAVVFAGAVFYLAATAWDGATNTALFAAVGLALIFVALRKI